MVFLLTASIHFFLKIIGSIKKMFKFFSTRIDFNSCSSCYFQNSYNNLFVHSSHACYSSMPTRETVNFFQHVVLHSIITLILNFAIIITITFENRLPLLHLLQSLCNLILISNYHFIIKLHNFIS